MPSEAESNPTPNEKAPQVELEIIIPKLGWYWFDREGPDTNPNHWHRNLEGKTYLNWDWQDNEALFRQLGMFDLIADGD